MTAHQRTAVVVGLDYHAGIFCRKMNAHTRNWRYLLFPSTRSALLRAAFRLRTADALISLLGTGPHPLLRAVARACNVPILVIWAGTDVTKILQEPSKMPQSLRTELTHLAIAPWLEDELKQAGISAQYVPVIGITPAASEIPRSGFNVLSHLHAPRQDFYGRPHVYEVARALPDVSFSIVGSGDPDPNAPSNVHFYGWIHDIMPLIDRSAVILRVPDHDGMSLMVLEALARGRYVAWTYPLPGVKQVRTPADTIGYLRELSDRHAKGELGLNQAGIDYIAKNYDERRVSLGFEAQLDSVVEAAGWRKAPVGRIAITGLEIFAADVADLNNRLRTGWDARVLRLETTFEILGSLYNLSKSDVWYTVGTPQAGRSITRVARVMKKPRVVHWAGTDIDVARRNPDILKTVRRDAVAHLTEVEWEADELSSLGIEAAIAPLPPRFTCPSSIPPLPAMFTLLAYLPRSRTDFYGSSELEIVVRAFRGRPVKFLIVGGGQIEAQADGAVENMGWVYSLGDVYARSSALLRFTPRDGLSLMVLEALAFGRHVLWTKSFPFVKQIHTVDDICQKLDGLLSSHEAGELQPQTDAAQFIRTQYDREKCVRTIAAAWAKAAGKKARFARDSR